MINDVITGVALKLNEYFGDGYRIYKNDVKQGLKEPCFFIVALAPSRTEQLGERWRVDIPLDVHYFPEKQRDNAEIYDIESSLMDILSSITLPDGSSHRGRDIHCEAEDSVLHTFVTYSIWLRKVNNDALMNGLDVDAHTKEK